jgi:hypothetical protein
MALRHQNDPEHFGLQPNGRYLPGRAEIKRVCAEIQSRWSAHERNKRRRWAQPLPFTLQEVSLAGPTVRIFD